MRKPRSEVTTGKDRIGGEEENREGRECRDRGGARVKLFCVPIDMSGCPSGFKITAIT